MIGSVNSPGQKSSLSTLPPARGELADDMLDLAARFQSLGRQDALVWDSQYVGMEIVGRGGQGVVFRCERAGVDDFRLPVALKAFSPEVYACADDYESDMRRIAAVSMRVALLQNHHLLDVYNFIEENQIRVMVMEWVNGYDLRQLLSKRSLELARARISDSRWSHLTNVVITSGPDTSRLKPGVAIEILRECLSGLASLHRAGVAHGDVKPANVMVNLAGNVKLVDFGSAVDMEEPGSRIAWTPAYAAPELLDGAPNSPQSDLASLGYVLVEMLSGATLFRATDSIEDLRAMKWELPERLRRILPPDVVRNKELMDLCFDLVNPDPSDRMGSAEEANIVWAANLHRQLVKTGLDSEYENDLRVWMESLPPTVSNISEPDPTRSILAEGQSLMADQSTLVDKIASRGFELPHRC
jgi:serine/threonine-protein kinase